MEKLFLILIIAVLSYEAFGMSNRQKRQNEEEGDLEDRNQANIDQCRRTCPVTSEYNPVCGTNGVTYNNPSRLFCDQFCGVSVTLLRSSRCPTATVAPTA
ncbi:uncharacterized protein LOC123658733 [Melitaea cinxia]|uniref:uncharacterized protein LOC123658733 n=1 Tax=Melitaea cinxia TaxID=113334 RepID=UPI001E26F33C|nr:uncharacterized protein LOC123658733 [Melitaea cinxia]